MTKTELKSRWKFENNFLSIIKANCQGEEHNARDLKGIPYGDNRNRNSLENITFKFVDFSFASFENCNFIGLSFAKCIFKDVDFSDLRQWNCKFENCLFEKANFNNATLGVKNDFRGCIFLQAKLKGKYFSFGEFNLFDSCNFLHCDIRSAWIIATRFESCVFESIFKNVRFSGEVEAKISGNYPATLTNCNLTKSIFRDVEIMDGAKFEKTSLPAQKHERINNDRIYYRST